MEKVYRREKTVRVFAGLSSVIYLLCVLFALVFLYRREYEFLIVLSTPFLIGLSLSLIAFIEYKHTLILNTCGIQFNYRVFSQSARLNRAKVFLRYDEIEYIRADFIPGDGIISKDTTRYRFFLTNHQELEVWLHHFGKENEKKIVAEISKQVAFKQ